MSKRGTGEYDNAIAFLGLGSNIGDRAGNLDSALKLLSEADGIQVLKVSSYHETAPVGYIEQPDFINAVVKICTDLGPKRLLDTCMQIEKKLKRSRDIKWGPRTIDIDILLIGDLILCDKDLTIPHPFMHEREFVLKPLCEISSDVVHPILNKTIDEIVIERETNYRRNEE